MLEQLTIREGELLNENTLSQDVVTLKEYYQKKGYKQVEITAEQDVDAVEGLVTVTLRITEGKKIRIKRIHINGVTKFKEKKILRVMKTKRKGWLINAGLYEEKKFRDDLERIKAF